MSENKNNQLIQSIIDNDMTLLRNEDNGDISGSIYSLSTEQQKLIFPGLATNSLIQLTNLRLLDIAALFDSIECFIYLHNKLGQQLEIENANNYLPLHYACFSGSTEVALYILSVKPDLARTKPQFNEQQDLIFCAVYGSKVAILRELIRCGANLNILTDRRKQMIFDRAIGLSNDEIIDELFLDLDPFYNMLKVQDFVLDPSKKAVFAYNLHAIKTLYQGNIDVVSSKNISKSFAGLIKVICNIDEDGTFKDFLKQILHDANGYKIDPVENENRLEEGVCHWICKYKDVEIAELMLKTPKYNINRFDANHKTGAAYLAEETGPQVLRILQMLIDHGFDVNAQQPGYPSLLECFICAINPNIELIKFLLDHGANPNVNYSRDANLTLTQFVQQKIRNNLQMKALFPLNQ